jgi:hypothetical protein
MESENETRSTIRSPKPNLGESEIASESAAARAIPGQFVTAESVITIVSETDSVIGVSVDGLPGVPADINALGAN